MKTAKELFGDDYDWDNEYYGDYNIILKQFGDILIQVDEDNYQGDSWLLYKKNDKYGYLCFGWGSCSGCDALQGAESIEEVQEIMDHLNNNIIWFDSLGDCLNFFNEHDWEGDYCYDEKELNEFIDKVKEYININMEKKIIDKSI